MNETAIFVPEERAQRSVAAIPNANLTPQQMVSLAVSQGADVEKLKQLMDLQERWEANEARKAFTAAKSAFKKNPPKVIKDLENKQYKSMYASIGNFVTTVNAALGEHGLEASWSLNQGDQIEVTCVLSHVMGHSERVMLKSGPDTSGAKNPLQQIKSAITYLELATFQAITGIVAINEGNDDGAAVYERITEDQAANLQALIDEVGANKIQFLRYLKVDTLSEIAAGAFKDCVRLLEDKRKK